MTLIHTETIRPAARSVAVLRALFAYLSRRRTGPADLPLAGRPAQSAETSADAATRLNNLANGARLRR